MELKYLPSAQNDDFACFESGKCTPSPGKLHLNRLQTWLYALFLMAGVQHTCASLSIYDAGEVSRCPRPSRTGM